MTLVHKKSDLPGIEKSLDNLSELYVAERYSMAEAQNLLQKMAKESYSHNEIFGTYADVHEYVNCSVEDAFKYCQNVFSLEDWTFSVRNLKHVKDSLYKGLDVLANDTEIFVKVESSSDAKTVDYLCAWDQGQELWMRYYMRFLDAQQTLGKPGTIVTWLNCRHPYYNRPSNGSQNNPLPKHVIESQARQDRPWVGDLWNLFAPAHQIEARNLKLILEHRFGDKM